jgi:hypothetical protein
MTDKTRAYARHIGNTHARDMMDHPDATVGAAVSVEAGRAVARAVEESHTDRQTKGR